MGNKSIFAKFMLLYYEILLKTYWINIICNPSAPFECKKRTQIPILSNVIIGKTIFIKRTKFYPSLVLIDGNK